MTAVLTPSTNKRAGVQGLGWVLILLFTLISIPLHLGPPTPDVSWLIHMCEEILKGRIAYVDILETTPPIPTLLYMPTAVASRLLDVQSETANVIVAYISGILTLWLSAAILPKDTPADQQSSLLIIAAAAAVMFLFPSDSFTQREYFAAVFVLPMVATFICHVQSGRWPTVVQRIAAALLAALTLAIKPPVFLIPGVFAVAYCAIRTRSVLFLITSGVVPAVVIAVVLTATSFALFPQYFDHIWALMQDVYVPARSHPLYFLTDRVTIGALLAFTCTAAMQIGGRASPAVWLLVSVGGGFLIAYFVQGKYFPYHAYPAALFLTVALVLSLGERVRSAGTSDRMLNLATLSTFALACVAVSFLTFTGLRDTRPRLQELSWAAGLTSPTVMAISPDIATSFPLTRQIGGIWIDSAHSQWVARYTRKLLSEGNLTASRRLQLEQYHRADVLRVIHGIESRRPDIVLVDLSRDYAWLLKELLAISPRLLADYSVLIEDSRVRVLRHVNGNQTEQSAKTP